MKLLCNLLAIDQHMISMPIENKVVFFACHLIIIVIPHNQGHILIILKSKLKNCAVPKCVACKGLQ